LNSNFHWVIHPNQQLIPNIEEYGKRALVAIQAAATYWGQLVQDEARKGATWTDRTGHARGGLFFAVDGFGLSPITGMVTPEAEGKMTDIAIESGSENKLIITLGHTVFYGKFLELSNGGRYAIIMSTIEANIAQLENMVQEIFS
jgi:hypothetical protein